MTSTLFSSNILAAAAQAVVPTPAQAVAQAAATEAVIAAASKALATDRTITVPGLVRPLYDHQVAALAYAQDSIARNGGVLIGDDMGMGKTAVALALIAMATANGGYAVVVTPPANLGGYEREVRDAFPGLTMAIAKGHKPYRIDPAARLVWMSDDAKTMRSWLADREVKDASGHTRLVVSPLAANAVMFVRDEIHRDKGNMSKPTLRARVSLAVAASMRDQGRPVVGMTGTLLVNRPVEAFLPLQIVGGADLVKRITPGARTLGQFLVRYCQGDSNAFGTSWNGASNTAELHDRLRATCYVRREKGDLADGSLPHFGWSLVPFAFGKSKMARYQRTVDDMLALIQEEKGPEAAWRASRAEAIVRMQRMWSELGAAKVDAAVDYVADLVDQGDQVVVFYQHTEVFEALVEGFTKKGIVVGWVNGQTKDRRAMEDDFQAGRTTVMLAQLQAAGQALTLTAARHAVWLQTPWSAGMLAQQRDRIRRCDAISKARAEAGVAVQFHVLQAMVDNGTGQVRETFDAAMWGVLESKAAVVDAVNAGQDVTLPDESIMAEALRVWFDSL